MATIAVITMFGVPVALTLGTVRAVAVEVRRGLRRAGR